MTTDHPYEVTHRLKPRMSGSPEPFGSLTLPPKEQRHLANQLCPVHRVMRPQQNEFDGCVGCFSAVRACHDKIILLFSAGLAVEVNNDKIASYRT